MDWGDIAPYLSCPVCNSPLTQTHTTLGCFHGHTFDIAREGYVNLLPAPRRVSKHAGDSRSMLHARRAFLQHGHYQRLSDAVNALALSHLSHHVQPMRKTASLCTLDIGCGEGYYLGRLQDAARHALQGDALKTVGIDVAKDAARLAAKRYREGRFMVADVRSRLPFADASMTLLLNIFAPRHATEFRRVVSTKGLLIVVIPTPNHLAEIRAAIPLLGIEREKRERVCARFAGHFVCVEEMTLSYTIMLDQETLAALIGMMPSGRDLTAATQERIGAISRIQSQVEFSILAFRPVQSESDQ